MQVIRAAVGALALLATTSEARAGNLFGGSSPGSDGWGLVPGLRYGALKGTFDGVVGSDTTTTAWGTTTELHVDFLHTFGHDRRAYGASLGYLMQGNDPGAADSFGHDGMALTGFLSTVISGRNSAALRLGVVSGETQTGAGTIDAKLWRLGAQLTHVFTVSVFDLGASLGVEYFTGSDSMRGYHATAIVLGLTGALSLY